MMIRIMNLILIHADTHVYTNGSRRVMGTMGHRMGRGDGPRGQVP